MVKLINLILKLFKRKLVKVRCIDEINLDSISPVNPSKLVQCGTTKISLIFWCVSGIVKKQHYKWEIKKCQ